MRSWSFLTSHAQVLMCIARDPGVRLRDIAAGLGITGRSARGIVTDLAQSGYVVQQKYGRRNRYQIQAHLPLPESASHELAIGEVIALLIGASPCEGLDPAWRHQGSSPSSGTSAPTPSVLCDESTQKCERGAERTQHSRAAPRPDGLLPGALVEQRRNCGEEGCRCTRGDLHGPHVYLQVAGRLV